MFVEYFHTPADISVPWNWTKLWKLDFPSFFYNISKIFPDYERCPFFSSDHSLIVGIFFQFSFMPAVYNSLSMFWLLIFQKFERNLYEFTIITEQTWNKKNNWNTQKTLLCLSLFIAIINWIFRRNIKSNWKYVYLKYVVTYRHVWQLTRSIASKV